MNLESSWRREPGIVARRIAGETLLVPVSQRVQEMGLFTLNEVGTFVWEHLDGAQPVGNLVAELVHSFEVDEATATADLVSFIELLERTRCASQVSPAERASDVSSVERARHASPGNGAEVAP